MSFDSILGLFWQKFHEHLCCNPSPPPTTCTFLSKIEKLKKYLRANTSAPPTCTILSSTKIASRFTSSAPASVDRLGSRVYGQITVSLFFFPFGSGCGPRISHAARERTRSIENTFYREHILLEHFTCSAPASVDGLVSRI